MSAGLRVGKHSQIPDQAVESAGGGFGAGFGDGASEPGDGLLFKALVAVVGLDEVLGEAVGGGCRR